jgi:hypothetical protein
VCSWQKGSLGPINKLYHTKYSLIFYTEEIQEIIQNVDHSAFCAQLPKGLGQRKWQKTQKLSDIGIIVRRYNNTVCE